MGAKITAKKPLTKAQEFAESVINTIREPLIVLDQDLRVVSASRSFYDFFKVNPKETVGQLIYDLGNKHWDIPKLRELLETILPQKATFDNYEVEHDFATIGKRKMLLNARQIQRGLGKERIILLAIEDITERKQAEVELDRLFEVSPDMICIIGFDGFFKRLNPAWEKTLGHPMDDFLSKPFIEFVHPEDHEATNAEVAKLAQGVRTLRFENRYRCKDDSYRWLSWSVIPVIEEKLLYCVARDITERKQAEEELQEKNAELVRFAYTVSHDLKSPVVTIKTFLGYLEQDVRNKDAVRMEKDFEYIGNAADKMSRLLDELLELSRVGRKTNPPVEVSLQTIVKEALDLVAGQIADRGVKVEVTEEPILLYGDRPRLGEVFQNLIDNAVKFMGNQPKPCLEIGVEQVGEETVFFVRDNGIGIDMRHQTKLFNLFEKLDPNIEGTGIGLVLVKRIVELHGGKIWVESEGPGKGTTFRFTLAKTRRQLT
jgi:PAS domain S-box-containing protein